MSVSAPPPLNEFAADAYAYLAPISDPDAGNGYPIACIMGAVGVAFDQVEAVARARADRQPYQQVYDITVCPDGRVPGLLGWLGQFLGVPWVPYTDSVAKRTQVQAEAQFYRGSPSVLAAAVGATLTDPTRVEIVERDPDAWGVVVGYDPAYALDPNATAAAAAAAVPWGILLQVSPSSLPLFEEGTDVFENVAGTVTFEDATLINVTT